MPWLVSVSIPTLKSWTLALTHLHVSKAPGVGQMLWSFTERGMCFERDTAVNRSELALTWPQDLACADETWRCPGVTFASSPCFISTRGKRGICALPGTTGAMCKGAGRTVYAPAAPEVSTPFLEPWCPVCLLTLKIPLLPSLRGERTLGAWTPLLHSLVIE